MFKEMGRDKTCIIITHRLGAARLADWIFVLSDGKIVESGNHEQLIKSKGKYYDMYQMQKTMYYDSY